MLVLSIINNSVKKYNPLVISKQLWNNCSNKDFQVCWGCLSWFCPLALLVLLPLFAAIIVLCDILLWLIRMFLKAYFVMFYGVPLYFSQMLCTLFVWSRGCLNLDHNTMLLYAFLSDDEKKNWIATVDTYISCFKTNLEKKSYLEIILKGHFDLKSVKYVETPNLKPAITYLHTGSIPSKFGKPVMLLNELDPVVADSFP